MKVILSRKGFDSENGGYPSPILPDGRLISLPIPSKGDPIHYSDLWLDADKSYYDLMQELDLKTIRYDRKLHELNRNAECHPDPDIYRNIRRRDEGWRPLFGQVGNSQRHLEKEKQEVGEGDIFLFFGWFKETSYKDGKLRFTGTESHKQGKHVIFGYFQIEDKKQITQDTEVPPWMKYHPHVLSYRTKSNNTIYVARNYLSWDSRFPGADVFHYHPSQVLTKEGYSRSKWQLPELFRHVRISYHSEKSWKDGYFQSCPIGQEFVIEENQEVEKWAKKLIQSNLRI